MHIPAAKLHTTVDQVGGPDSREINLDELLEKLDSGVLATCLSFSGLHWLNLPILLPVPPL